MEIKKRIMKKIIIFSLFLVVVISYGNSQTIVKLLLPDNCGSNQTIVEDIKKNIDTELELYPNPNEGSFTLKVSFKSQIDKANISIYNSLGVIVFNENIFCNSRILFKQLNLKNLSAGIYLIIIKNTKQKVSTELIIK
jgi:hypothetical protein